MTQPTLIIGAGIAGCSMAHALAMRGKKVLIFEKSSVPAQGASGNPMGVLFPQLTKVWTPISRFSFMTYAYMQRKMVRWRQEGRDDLFSQLGMIQLPRSESDVLKFENLYEKLGLSHDVVAPYSAGQVREAMPHYSGADGFYFPHGTAVNVRVLCRYYCDHPLIEFRGNAAVDNIHQTSDGWRVSLESGEAFETENVVLCNATDLLTFEKTAHYPLFWNRGQLSYLPADAVHYPLEKIICHKGYIVPLNEGGYLIGATYDREFHGCELRAEDHEENLAAVRAQFPGWVKDEVRAKVLGGRASNRSVSKDRAPMIGPLVDVNGEVLAGLYCSVAHGSRGLLTAPMGAKYLANLITGAPFNGLPVDIEKAVTPARFMK